MSTATLAPSSGPAPQRDDRYKWTVLSNTTLGVFMASLDSSIVLISLPAIFRGIKLDPLQPSNIGYLLWMLMGYLVVTAVLVVTFGRLGDMFGRVRMYNAGFAVFSLASLALSLCPWTGGKGAMWLIAWRVVQGVGGALLTANSAAILTDAFHARQRGFAIGVNVIAGMAGAFIGLVVGGILADVDWRAVFWINVPIGVFGTVWAYLKLKETGIRKAARIDWWGNITFGVGLVLILVGMTYGLQPAGGHSMGWTSPVVLAELIGGALILVLFCLIESRVEDPMFNLQLFKIRAFAAGNISGLLAAMGRGGLQFVLIIWLQGIWLPLHGYSFERTPLWAGIYMLPLTAGFLLAGPVCGWLSDRWGARLFTTGGMLLAAVSFALLMLLPVNFGFPVFGALLLLNGIGTGMFSAPNMTAIMNAAPPDERGAASGMRATFQNTGMVVSIGLFFSLMIVGLSASLPGAMASRLQANGVTHASAERIAHTPAVGSLFAAILGYNPMQKLLGAPGPNGGPSVLAQLSKHQAATITGKEFFPHLISGPFKDGLIIAFSAALVMCLIAAAASWARGSKYVHGDAAAPEDDGVGPFGAPLDEHAAPGEAPEPEEWVPA
ncbi:MAG: putative transrane efflux pump (multidrug resistance related protein) [Actinomycetia bacterium]|nr:putative transrane efflux pump (multidrug resistance related protein) [Actinomycetes bacterium]